MWEKRGDADMARRRDIDWMREWIEEQQEERLRRHPPLPSQAHLYNDWSFIPTTNVWDDPDEGEHRLFVVQACLWRDDWDECACWSPVIGTAIRAFADFVEAQWFAKQQQTLRGERLGMIETDVRGPLSEEVFLVKETGLRDRFFWGR